MSCTLPDETPPLISANLPFLCALSKAKTNRARRKLISTADSSNLRALGLLVFNFLNSNIPVDPANLEKMTPYVRELRKLSRKTTSKKNRREVLLKRGGFLPLIGSLVAGVLPSLLGKIIRWLYKEPTRLSKLLVRWTSWASSHYHLSPVHRQCIAITVYRVLIQETSVFHN